MIDWNNGRLGSDLEPECYRDALAALPEDARLYTTAPEEITRALRASLVARAPRRESAKEPRSEQAASPGGGSRQLSGRHRELEPAPGGAEAETTGAPVAGAVSRPSSLPLPIALTATVILVICAGAVASVVAGRLRVRRLARRGAPGPL